MTRRYSASGTPTGRAPAALRARVTAALARERRPLWRRVFAPIPLATAAACAAGVLVVLATHASGDGLLVEADGTEAHRTLWRVVKVLI